MLSIGKLQKLAGGLLVALGLAVLLAGCGSATPTSDPNRPAPLPTVVAPTAPVNNEALKSESRQLLGQLWETYKQRYMQSDGRVRDRDPYRQDDPTTSEGQAYALLRALWQNDRATFDSALNWSVSNLQRPRGDKLFAYLWGKQADGSWGVLDNHAASDADQDIAFALLLASRQWNEPRYGTQAQEILNDLWNKTVVTIKGQPYLTAGDWSPALPQPVLNPSYFMPYEYRVFARLDPDQSHHWAALVDTSYQVIEGCTANKLDTNAAGKLPPNWCAIDKATGQFGPANGQNKGLDSNFGYDAFRTVWRVALDYQWNGEKRAAAYLQSLGVLKQDWQTGQKLATSYDHAGQPLDEHEDLGIYAGAGLPLLLTTDPAQADRLVATKLLSTLRQAGQNDDPDPAHTNASQARTYYAQNWVWFGLALYAGALPRPAL